MPQGLTAVLACADAGSLIVSFFLSVSYMVKLNVVGTKLQNVFESERVCVEKDGFCCCLCMPLAVCLLAVAGRCLCLRGVRSWCGRI